MLSPYDMSIRIIQRAAEDRMKYWPPEDPEAWQAGIDRKLVKLGERNKRYKRKQLALARDAHDPYLIRELTDDLKQPLAMDSLIDQRD